MMHIHAKADDGMATHDVERIRATHDAIKERVPEVIVNLSSAVGPFATPEQRIAQIVSPNVLDALLLKTGTIGPFEE